MKEMKITITMPTLKMIINTTNSISIKSMKIQASETKTKGTKRSPISIIYRKKRSQTTKQMNMIIMENIHISLNNIQNYPINLSKVINCQK